MVATGGVGLLGLVVGAPLLLGAIMICPGILGIPFAVTFLRIG